VQKGLANPNQLKTIQGQGEEILYNKVIPARPLFNTGRQIKEVSIGG